MIFAENKPSTEPFSFVFLKKLCSFALVITLVFYIYNQFSLLSDSIVKPNLSFRKQKYANIKIIVGVCSPSHPINCTYNYNYECKLDEHYDHHNISNCNYFTFSFQDSTEIKINSLITGVYLDGIVLDDKYYLSRKLSTRQSLPLLSEQTMVVYYSITISKDIVNNYVYGLAGGDVKEYVDFNAHTDHITALTSSASTLLLIPTLTDIYYQEESYYDLGSIISNVGGFFSSLSGFFVFLFGATKLAPWGFLQTHAFNCLCTRYQKRLMRKLKTKYEPIPFISGRTRNVTLEERVQSIENILKEYYLDTNFLNSLIEDNKVDDKV